MPVFAASDANRSTAIELATSVPQDDGVPIQHQAYLRSMFGERKTDRLSTGLFI
jgi:hypothetical protein